jgi:hypothetical protein
MMHAAVISALHVLLPPQRFSTSSFMVRAAVLLLYPLCAGVMAAATLHWVEEPAREAIRNLTGRPSRLQPATATADEGH